MTKTKSNKTNQQTSDPASLMLEMMAELWQHRHPSQVGRWTLKLNCLVFVIQDLNTKLTTLQEQATTVENNMQTSQEIAQAYEQKNKVRMKTILWIPNNLLRQPLNLIPRVLRTLGTRLGKVSLIGGYLRAKIQNQLSTNQSLYSYVINM